METCKLCNQKYNSANLRKFYHWKFEWFDICYGCIAELITKAMDKRS